jgi:hypothetical protein
MFSTHVRILIQHAKGNIYGCETWFLTFREKHRLRVFENRVLRRIFGPKRDEGIGGWRKLHDEGRHNLLLFAKYN